MQNEKDKNIAFIDGQNLYMATSKREVNPWDVDLVRFRIYLEQKYHATKAYYFLGFVQEENNDIYEGIQRAGFVLLFREHNPAMLGTKKGNVDSDIIFNVMKKLYKKEDFEKVVLVSGDGDYKRMVDFLIEEKKFEKILFPDRDRASSLYKKIGATYFAALDDTGVRAKIRVMKKAP
ncbi:MAG: NYN domain-containing protein [Patescibacteria group bacterium]